MQAQERRLLIAESTLQAPLQDEAGMLNIREEEDLALLSQSSSQSSAQPALHSTAAPANTILQAEESRGQSLVAEGSKGGKSGRRRSVTFAARPQVEDASSAGLQQSQGLRKGFFGKPKPVLKKSSSISNESVSTEDWCQSSFPEETRRSDFTGGRQAQNTLDEGRDAAFSGHVIERSMSPSTHSILQESAKPLVASQADVGGHEVAHGSKKVSRFKQERQRST